MGSNLDQEFFSFSNWNYFFPIKSGPIINILMFYRLNCHIAEMIFFCAQFSKVLLICFKLFVQFLTLLA